MYRRNTKGHIDKFTVTLMVFQIKPTRIYPLMYYHLHNNYRKIYHSHSERDYNFTNNLILKLSVAIRFLIIRGRMTLPREKEKKYI